MATHLRFAAIRLHGCFFLFPVATSVAYCQSSQEKCVLLFQCQRNLASFRQNTPELVVNTVDNEDEDVDVVTIEEEPFVMDFEEVVIVDEPNEPSKLTENDVNMEYV